MTEPIKTVGPDLETAWADWRLTVQEGKLALFVCKACEGDAEKPTKYLCSLPLSSGAKAVLRSHIARHAAGFAHDIRRVK